MAKQERTPQSQIEPTSPQLEKLRTEIAHTDRILAVLIGRRLRQAREIALVKDGLQLPTYAQKQQESVLNRADHLMTVEGEDSGVGRRIWTAITDESIRVQNDVRNYQRPPKK